MIGTARSLRLALVAAALLVGGPAAAQDVANVELSGETVFTVAAAGETSATARARRISARLSRRLASSEPLAPLRIQQTDSLAALVVGGDTLVVVTPSDAEVAAGRPLEGAAARAGLREVARGWAEALGAAFQDAALEERAQVVVQGNPLFEVSGTPEVRARRRAEAVGVRIGELAAQRGPPPELRVAARGGGAVILAGDEVLVEVGAAEAAAHDTTPLALAEEWARSIRGTVETLRQQRSGWYGLRIAGFALLATLLVAALHLGLRWLSRRVPSRGDAERAPAWGLLPVLAQWGVHVLQFAGWLLLGVYILWLIPRTRPLTFAASAEAVDVLRSIAAWLVDRGLIIALILLATFFAARFVGSLVRQAILAFAARHEGRTGLRAETLAGTMVSVAKVLMVFAGLVVVLSYLEFDPLPLLASAGVVGIALGFGVQSLIRDFFTGLFILLEDQYGVGDLITVGGVSGKVERFTLRITQIRSLDGSLTSIPNGEIKSVTNLSKDWSQVVLDVNIALGEDVDHAIEVIDQTAEALAKAWGDRIQGEPEVLGVETVDPLAQAVTIRVVLKTAPLERWAVSRELRRRILDAFREEEIQVPPRAVVMPGESPRPV